MIYIKLEGGLGNQLFQIFAGVSYAIDNNIPFKIEFNKHDLISQVDHVSKRPTYWNNFFKNIVKYTSNSIPYISIYREIETFKYIQIPNVTRDFIITGYFQSYLYFNKNIETIKNLLDLNTFITHLKDENTELFIKKLPIALHFRLGDYKCISFHPILGIEYYTRAIHMLLENIPYLREKYYILYFFETQDKEIVYNNISKLSKIFPDLEFRACDENMEDWKQLLLMSLCSHNIIANSTFSWWGGYFNTNPDKIVCYPNKWINIPNSLEDLFPKEWKQIST